MPQTLPEIKRVCIYGVGGVGGYYGARLAAAGRPDRSGRVELYFIARGRHLEAIQQNGLTLKTPQGTLNGQPDAAVEDFTTIPTPDLVLLCTKSYDLPGALERIRANIREDSVIIPLLNGIDIYERIRNVLTSAVVLPACIYLGTHIESPGVINQSGGNGIILSGPDPRRPDFSAAPLISFFSQTGIGFEYRESAYPAVWEKYIFIAAFGLVTASSGLSLGQVMENPDLRELTAGIMREIASLAAAREVRLAPDIVAQSLQKAFNFPYETRTSYQRDLEAGSRPDEGDLYGGTLVREGLREGVPTPLIEQVYSRIAERPHYSA